MSVQSLVESDAAAFTVAELSKASGARPQMINQYCQKGRIVCGYNKSGLRLIEREVAIAWCSEYEAKKLGMRDREIVS
jgi:hypothetical protein